jgi:hypothetical protein
MLVVSGTCPNYQNGAVNNQLTDIGGGGLFGVRVNLLMCDRGGTLYSVHAQANKVSK